MKFVVSTLLTTLMATSLFLTGCEQSAATREKKQIDQAVQNRNENIDQNVKNQQEKARMEKENIDRNVKNHEQNAQMQKESNETAAKQQQKEAVDRNPDVR